MTRPMTTLTLLAIVAVATQLTGCDQASGAADSGPSLQEMIKGPPISVDGPHYALQKNGSDMQDGHGGVLAYTDPVIAGIVLERLSIGDPRSLYSVELRGGFWGVDRANDGETPLFTPDDIYVAQNGSSGQAAMFPLVSTEATFQIATTGFVEWYIDGVLVGEGASATFPLPRGEAQLSAVIWGEDGSSQSLSLTLYVEVNLTQVTINWSPPAAREDDVALGIEELCCYQVQYFVGNEFAVVDVAGGATRSVTLGLAPGHYRVSMIAIDTQGQASRPSASVEAVIS